MSTDELKRINVIVDFKVIETRLDQLLSKKEIKDLAKKLQGEKDRFVIQDVVTESIMNNISIDDISIDNIELNY